VRELTGAANLFTVKPNAGTVGFWRVECVNTGATRIGSGWFLDNGAKAVLGKCGATNFAHLSWLDRGDMNVVLNNETGAGQIVTDVDDLFGMSAASVKVNGDFTNHTFTDELFDGSTGIYVKNGELISSKRLLANGLNSIAADSNGIITFWLDSINGNDANDGLAQSRPKKTLLTLFQYLRTFAGSNVEEVIIYMADGGSYTLPNGYYLSFPFILHIYGSATEGDHSLVSTIQILGTNGMGLRVYSPVLLYRLKFLRDISENSLYCIVFNGYGLYVQLGYCEFINTNAAEKRGIAVYGWNPKLFFNSNGATNFSTFLGMDYGEVLLAKNNFTDGRAILTNVNTYFTGLLTKCHVVGDNTNITAVNYESGSGEFVYQGQRLMAPDVWENVPFTLKNGYTSAGLSQFNVKYNKALKAYSITFSGLNKVDMTFGEVIATVNAPLPMTPPRQMYGGSIILDTYSAENTPVGRLAVGLGIKANGDIQIWPTDTTKTTGTVPNTKPGRLYGRVIFTLEEWTT
jgi:hypothetical protein